MKNSILTIAMIMNLTWLFAQPCLPEGISFYFQEDIDNFQINHPGCTEIEGNVKFLGSEILNLLGLNVVTAIGGDLTFESVNNLTSLEGLNNLQSVGGNLKIQQTQIVNMSGLQDITEVGGDFEISYNQNIENLIGLENLTTIEGQLLIRNNYSLINFLGLEHLMNVSEIVILSNNSLQSINSLDKITSVASNVSISHNYSLKNMDGLHNLTHIGSSLFIWSNFSLKTLEGLNSVSSVGLFLEIAYNDSLLNFHGMENLREIGSVLDITENIALTTFDGYDSLTSIGDIIHIKSNSSLTNLSALQNMNSASINDLKIVGNESLSVCHVESICNYLSNPSGSVEIQDNAPGCNSPEEVIEACSVDISDNKSNPSRCIILPNPFRETVIVTFHSNCNENTSVSLITSAGYELKRFNFQANYNGYQQFKLQTSDLTTGIYFLKVKSETGVQMHKVIKL